MVLANKFNIIMNRKKIQRITRKYNITCPIRKANPYKRIAKAIKMHFSILTKALIIQVQPFKNYLKNITWVNLCLVEAIV